MDKEQFKELQEGLAIMTTCICLSLTHWYVAFVVSLLLVVYLASAIKEKSAQHPNTSGGIE